jgi:hypothetical protein
MKIKLAFLALFAQFCFAESPFIIGVRGGVPLGDVINAVQSGSGVSSATDNYVVGPTLGIRLPLGFSVAGDALFSRLSLSSTGTGTTRSFSASANSWEFPVLLRFTPGGGEKGIAPFVGAGVSLRHLGDFGDVGSFLTNSSSNTSVINGPSVGFVIGGGLQFHAGPLHISPEIRYTHWGSNQISSAFNNVIRLNDNQGQILVGITF